MDKKVLEERLINFAVLIIQIANQLPNTRVGAHLSGQISRSGTSSALNYGEAQSAESRKDFIHKIQIVLKELRETLVCLKIIERSSLLPANAEIELAINESNELISIFVKSVETAKKNLQSKIVNR
jgi:four helix bundle protein